MIASSDFRNLDFRELIHFLRRDMAAGTQGMNLYSSVLEALRKAQLCSIKPYTTALSSRIRDRLNAAGAVRDLERLLELGVQEDTICCAVMLFQFLPTIDLLLRSFLGDMQDRKQKANKLYHAARVMDEVAKHVPPGKIGTEVASPALAAASLHFYANFLSLREQILTGLDANSGLEISKYILASVVYRITRKYHDREVSGIVGALLEKEDYDETAHRVWRIRTVRRLDQTCSALPILLHALNSALTEQFESSSQIVAV